MPILAATLGRSCGLVAANAFPVRSRNSCGVTVILEQATEPLATAYSTSGRPYTKLELHAYLRHCREKCRRVLAGLADEEASRPCRYGSLELTFAELLLFGTAARAAPCRPTKSASAPEYRFGAALCQACADRPPQFLKEINRERGRANPPGSPPLRRSEWSSGMKSAGAAGEGHALQRGGRAA
jgi:hypothetical protein